MGAVVTGAGTREGSASLLMVFGCDWLGCQSASEFAADMVEGRGPVTPGGAKARELGVKLAEHRLRCGFAMPQAGEPVGPGGSCGVHEATASRAAR